MIGNLQHMFENQGVGDNHNAPVFLWCYKRMGEFIPQLVGEGKEPRIMLEYSGTLLRLLVELDKPSEFCSSPGAKSPSLPGNRQFHAQAALR